MDGWMDGWMDGYFHSRIVERVVIHAFFKGNENQELFIST